MNLIIPDHTVKTFVKRILNDPLDHIPHALEVSIKNEIDLAVESPDRIHHEKKDMPPIYIRGRLAVVVDEEKGEEGKPLIATVYHSSTFEKSNDRGEQPEAEPA